MALSIMPAELSCNIPFRASSARFDRPAASLAELLDGDGADFVHQAVWTVLNRRAQREEHARWLTTVMMDSIDGKGKVLAELAQKALSEGHIPRLAGMSNYLLLRQRRNTAITGPVLAAFTAFYLRYPQVGWPAKFARSIPGKLRWTYRHSRKAVLKLARRLQVPTASNVKAALGIDHGPVPDGTPPAVAFYYDRLVAARLERRHKN